MLKQIFDKTKKVAKATALAVGAVVIVYHGISQLNYLAKYIKNEINPSQARIEFQKATGVKVTGQRADDENRVLFDFLEVLAQDKIPRGALDKIVLESPNYFEKSLFGQLAKTIFEEYRGYFNPNTDNIVMDSTSTGIFAHELAHAKTCGHPQKKQLLKEWAKLSEDKDGKTPYLNALMYAGSRVKFLAQIVERNRDYREKGFVSNYAQTDVDEDIAEFLSVEPDSLAQIMNKQGGDQTLEKKLDLAIKFNLLPGESKEYVQIKRALDRWAELQSGLDWDSDYNTYRQRLKALKDDVLKGSEQFLRENPNSRYCCGVHNALAMIFSKGSSYYGTSWSEESLKELKKGLLSPKLVSDYGIALYMLRDAHQQLRRGYANNPYEKASIELYRRKDNLDLSLLKIGVNDFLIKLGALDPVKDR